MPGNGGNRNRCDRSPSVTDDQRWNGNGKDDARAKDGARDHRDQRRSRLLGMLALGRGAASVGLCLRDALLMSGVVGLTLVHRAGAAVCAARHAFLRRCSPARTHRQGAAGQQHQAQDERREATNYQHDRIKNAQTSTVCQHALVRIPVTAASSLAPQRGDRIDPCGASRRQIRGEDGRDRQHEAGAGERQGIGRRDAKKKPAQRIPDSER